MTITLRHRWTVATLVVGALGIGCGSKPPSAANLKVCEQAAERYLRCVGETLGPEAQRQADYDGCATPGQRTLASLPGLLGVLGLPGGMAAEAQMRDCMAAKGYGKSQQGMVEADNLGALSISDSLR